MTCTVYHKDRDGRVYAYSSEYYWDKEKGQPRSKRTYLGRVNPETGEIMRGRQNGKNYKEKRAGPVSAAQEPEIQRLQEALASKDAELAELKQTVKSMKSQFSVTARSLQKIADIASSAASAISG